MNVVVCVRLDQFRGRIPPDMELNTDYGCARCHRTLAVGPDIAALIVTGFTPICTGCEDRTERQHIHHAIGSGDVIAAGAALLELRLRDDARKRAANG